MGCYKIFLNEQLVCETDWPPMAQTAWNRAARDRDAAQHGGIAKLEKNGRTISSVKPEMGRGHPWPDSENPESNMRDVLKALLQLLRDDGWDAKEIAQAMTDRGLPTTRARIDALRGSSEGKRTEVTAAEVVTLINSVLTVYKSKKTD